MFLVILVGLVFPFPLAVHCLILASLNRRPHPVMIPGTWDFAEVLFAVSGFLLFGGPAILAGFNQRYREFLLYGALRPGAVVTEAMSYWWVAVWVAYLAAVLGMAAFVLSKRRRATSVYNIDAEAFQECLANVLDRLKLDWVRNGDRIYIGGRTADGNFVAGRMVLSVDMFPTMRHATMVWPPEAGPLRREIEGRLA